MKKIKRAVSVLLMVCLVLSLCGCSFTAFDSRTLMSPPAANADQQAIYRLLQAAGGQDIAFVYPKSGSYRSAITMQDFTGDGQPDAVGFYTPENASGGTEVQFLVKDEDVWRTASTFKNSAIQVDRMYFTDLTGNGVTDVVIGWGSTGSSGRTAAVCAYIYENGEVTEYALGNYGEMIITDLNSDGVSEIFTVDMSVPAQEEGEEPTPAQARVYGFLNGTMWELYSSPADNSVSSYASVAFGTISYQLSGVLVDGTKADGSVTTQVFYLNENRLVNAPAGVNTEEYVNPYTRPSAAALSSRDINGDGVLDIPVTTLLPGLPEDAVPDFTSFLVSWNVFQPDGTERIAVFALMNPPENYWFPLPEELVGNITASNDPENRTVSYRRVFPGEEEGEYSVGALLFSIRAFTRSEWESRNWAGYEALPVSSGQGETVYAIRVVSGDTRLQWPINRIKAGFSLLSE